MTDRTRPRRDALGQFCHVLHLAILAFILLGWLAPWRGLLMAYLVFLPAVILHWKLNDNACALNNLESWLRYRRWRAPDRNPEEGAWLRTLIRSFTGVMLTRARMDVIIYAVMGLCWAAAWWRLAHFQGP
jgi:hypothetical protein